MRKRADLGRALPEAGVLRARPELRAGPSQHETGLRPLGLGGPRDGLVFVPAGSGTGPLPLLLAFHGAGGAGLHMMDLLRPHAEARGLAVLAPDSRGPTWDVIRGGYGPDVDFIDRALRSVFDVAPIDPRRVAVTGFSDGASYALSLGITNGDLFGDILAFSPGFMAPQRQSGRPRVFISHGVRDEVLPIDPCSRTITRILRQGGYDLDHQEFADGHVVPQDMITRALDRFLA